MHTCNTRAYLASQSVGDIINQLFVAFSLLLDVLFPLLFVLLAFLARLHLHITALDTDKLLVLILAAILHRKLIHVVVHKQHLQT